MTAFLVGLATAAGFAGLIVVTVGAAVACAMALVILVAAIADAAERVIAWRKRKPKTDGMSEPHGDVPAPHDALPSGARGQRVARKDRDVPAAQLSQRDRDLVRLAEVNRLISACSGWGAYLGALREERAALLANLGCCGDPADCTQACGLAATPAVWPKAGAQHG